MRVLVAPDAVSPSGERVEPAVSAIDAAAHLADGWSGARPDDVVTVHPLTDGGLGLLDVMRTAVGGSPEAALARDGRGQPVPTAWLRVGATAVVDATSLLGPVDGDGAAEVAETGTSAGAGDLMAAALDAGARRIVLGAGATATHDGGIGALRALCGGSDGASAQDLVRTARARLAGIEVVVAAATDLALIGLSGAGAALARRPGIDATTAQAIESRLAPMIARMEEEADSLAPSLLGGGGRPVRPARRPYGGAGGGIAFALACAGARVLPGADVVAVETGLGDAVRACDLVLTACGELDGDALAIGVPGVVGRYAAGSMVPAIALAATTLLGRRELAGTGIEAAYPLLDPPPPGASATAVPMDAALSARAARVARTWSR